MEKRGGGERGRYGRLSYALRLQDAEQYDRGNAIAGQKYADWVSGDGGHDGGQGRASIHWNGRPGRGEGPDGNKSF